MKWGENNLLQFGRVMWRKLKQQKWGTTGFNCCWWNNSVFTEDQLNDGESAWSWFFKPGLSDSDQTSICPLYYFNRQNYTLKIKPCFLFNCFYWRLLRTKTRWKPEEPELKPLKYIIITTVYMFNKTPDCQTNIWYNKYHTTYNTVINQHVTKATNVKTSLLIPKLINHVLFKHQRQINSDWQLSIMAVGAECSMFW